MACQITIPVAVVSIVEIGGEIVATEGAQAPSVTAAWRATNTPTTIPSATPTLTLTLLPIPRLCIAYGDMDGLWIAEPPRPLYVLDINLSCNALVVGPAEELGRRILLAEDAHWVRGSPPAKAFRAASKIRYTSEEQPAEVTVGETGAVRVRFDRPLRDITPSQAAVFYDEKLCLGAALISEATE